MADPTDWILDAEEDLSSLRTFLGHGHPRHACFHAQQAAEKGLKALLLMREGRILRTHDLEQLLARIRTGDPTFPDHGAAAAVLTPYCTILRYPDTRPRVCPR